MDLDHLIQKVDNFLFEHYQQLQQTNESEISISVNNLDPRLRLSPCDGKLNFELRDNGSPGGNVSVHARCQSQQPWALYIPAQVSISQAVVVASRGIARNSVLSLADFDTQLRDISQLPDNVVMDAGRILGKVTKRNIRAGEVLRLSNVSEPTVIKRGDAVVIEARSGSILVSSQGVAMANGRIGDQISVRNTQSERIVRVKIIGPGRARVIL